MEDGLNRTCRRFGEYAQEGLESKVTEPKKNQSYFQDAILGRNEHEKSEIGTCR